MNINIISKYLQFLRKNHNFTQDELASKLDISRQAVSKWETGAAIPDLEVLLKISKLYDMIPGSKGQEIRCKLACKRIFELGTRKNTEK